MRKKYEFTDETVTVNGITLHRIKAVIDFDRFGVGPKEYDLQRLIWMKMIKFNIS